MQAYPRYNHLMSQMEDNWNILGHEWAVELLQSHLVNQRTRHAYLFTGPQGVGRCTLAIRLTQALNCPQHVKPGIPCGECRACRLIENKQHPDLSVVQAEEVGRALKVDQIRELQRTLSLAPYEAIYKVALLLRFEEANPNAANALLKSLEEPPPQVIMLLTASDSETLLPTIVSRCEVIRLRPLGIPRVSEGLQTHWGIPAEEANLLAHISGGRPGYAQKLSQNPEALEKRQIQLDDILRLLHATRVERFTYAEELSKDRAYLQNTLQTWLTLWRDLMLRAAGSHSPLTNIDREAEIQELANQIDLVTAQEIVLLLEKSSAQIENYINPRLVTECLMLDLPNLQ
jgi:DNA polymerase-3 subunit delta'